MFSGVVIYIIIYVSDSPATLCPSRETMSYSSLYSQDLAECQTRTYIQGKNNFVRSTCHSSCKDKYLKQKSDWKGNGKLSIDFENTEFEVSVGYLGGDVSKKNKEENFKVRTVL